MALSRRDFLKLGSLTAVAASASACSVIGRELADNELPDTLTVPATTTVAPITAVDPERRLLDRAGYGPRPGDLERVKQMGFAAYLEEQLDPEAIEDTATDLLIRNLSLYHMDTSQLAAQEPKDAVTELLNATLSRALYSKRQLYETMVEFWSDHFNIYLRKGESMPLFKILDDRDAIRPHALGKFRHLLSASAQSPAMLIYLDNIRNLKEEPNENYARELMELHTMGVNSGYTQTDVQELARALTGWTVQRRGRKEGEFAFIAARHDDGEKRFLGHTLAAGQGEQDVHQVLDILASHPATAHFIATKLVRRFVADDPPTPLVEEVAQTYQATDGDIKAMLRIIFLSETFKNAPPKLKRPYTYLVSVLRATHTNSQPNRAMGYWLRLLGQPLFEWPAPNGYPDVSAAWATNLLPRWNFALRLVHNAMDAASPRLEALVEAGRAQTSEEVLHLFSHLLYGRTLDTPSQTLFTTYVGDGSLNNPETQLRLKDSVALMLASPQFQWT